MSRQLAELESLVQMLVSEHEKLLAHLDAQQAAMRRLDARAMDEAASAAEAVRLRIVNLDNRRKALSAQLALALKVPATSNLGQIAEALPAGFAGARQRLLALRRHLRELVADVQARSQLAAKLAGGVLGHLNTVVRLISGAVEKAGLYTRHGTPSVSRRIGMLETTG